MNNGSNGSNQRGKKENIHIPRYIKNQPWYYKDLDGSKNGGDGDEKDDDYLIHHRQLKKGGALDIDNNSEPKIGLGIKDEFRTVSIVKKRHVGESRCTNCGSSDHVKRDCLERPRKLPNSFKNDDNIISIRKDSSENSDWDARKDRWFGYTGKEYNDLLKDWERKKKDAKKSKEQDEELLWDTDEEVELMKLGLYKDVMGTLKQDDLQNSQLQRASVRLREDRAAYLNDVNSDEIKYDPKSRLYKSEMLGSVDEKSRMFRRHLTGEAQELNELNRFSREHAKRMGIRDEIEDETKIKHVLVANPTRYEKLLQEQKRTQSQKQNTALITELEAAKGKGTAQSERTKKDLKDLYG